MGENNKVLLGVLSGVLLGAFGAAVVKRGNLRPHAAKVLSYETLKETCEDLAAEAKEKYEDRKAEEQKPAVTPAPTVVPEDSKKE